MIFYESHFICSYKLVFICFDYWNNFYKLIFIIFYFYEAHFILSYKNINRCNYSCLVAFIFQIPKYLFYFFSKFLFLISIYLMFLLIISKIFCLIDAIQMMKVTKSIVAKRISSSSKIIYYLLSHRWKF